MKKKILLIDDDIELCKLLEQCLGNEGYGVDCLQSGENALSSIKNGQVDLVILDIMLPGADGFTILKQIRAFSQIPVLMLSAKSEEMSKVYGLRTGADDYLTKPFGLSELMARVENLLRRCRVITEDSACGRLLSFDGLQIDMDKCIVIKKGKEIQITPKEYKLLCFLAGNPQMVFTKKQIYNAVWDEEFMYDDNTIMALISRLRKKLEDSQDEPQYIQTVWGIGYRFNDKVK